MKLVHVHNKMSKLPIRNFISIRNQHVSLYFILLNFIEQNIIKNFNSYTHTLLVHRDVFGGNPGVWTPPPEI